MTVFAEKNPLELEILGLAVSNRAQARIVMDILDGASWYHHVAFNAIEQVAKHGKILDQRIRDHPHVKEALLRPLAQAAGEDLEMLCWNHLGIVTSDTLMMLLRITAQSGYEDLRAILEEILRGNLEALDTSTETVCERSPAEELSPRVSAMIDDVIDARRVAAADHTTEGSMAALTKRTDSWRRIGYGGTNEA